MIIPLPLIGLALASAAPIQKKNSGRFELRKPIKSQKYSRPVLKKTAGPISFSFPKSLGNVLNGFTASISRVTSKKPSEDYEAVVRSFLPAGASILIPRHPVGIGKYTLLDVDGDSEKELITSYRHENSNTTIVLKKQNDKWEKTAETVNSKYTSINFLGSLRASNDKREHLLIGWKTSEGHGELLGYEQNNRKLIELFADRYNYLEVVNPINGKNSPKQSQLAVWTRKDSDAYDVNVKYWNGSELKPDENQSRYYQSRVLPYYGKFVKKMPYSASNWFNLAEALEKAGLYKDCLTAVDIGMRLNPASPPAEYFTKLKESVLKKI